MKPDIGSLFKFLNRSLMLCALALTMLTANAAGLSSKDEQQIIEVVKAQLNAFAADDAEKAFSFAAPNIRKSLGSAANFIEMVRTQYVVVYRPSATSFLKPVGHARDALIQVHMTDGAGVPWIASYTLQRQKNHAWRITGCKLDEAVGAMV